MGNSASRDVLLSRLLNGPRLKHTYRDPQTGRFAPVPPPRPPAARPTPPRWVDGRFVSRDNWNRKHEQETAFTGKAAATVSVFATRVDAAEVVAATVNGGSGDFLARAFTQISIRPTAQGWAVRVEYHYPARGEMSP